MNIKKVLIRIGIALFASAAGLGGYVVLKQPETANARPGKVPVTPERIARGRYIYETVGHCADCHSPKNWKKYLFPIDPKLAGAGGHFDVGNAFPGKVYTPNLTPDLETGLGHWTDGEKIRAIREGVSRDGRALFPLMPFPEYKNMSDEDVEALVAYMNSLAPIRNFVPKTQLDLPVRLAIKWTPQPVPGGIVPSVSPLDRLKYGQYLTKIGGCEGCHSVEDESRPFAGGHKFGNDEHWVRAANISPDMETGIGKWSEQRFVNRFAEFREYRQPGASFPDLTPANMTVMHWIPYAGMTDEDLKAIYAYLRTVSPQVNPVEIHQKQSR
jgi:mono/diheme cytochrome c family protein